MTQPDRPFRDEPTEVLLTALGLASRHAEQAARFNPAQDGPLPAVVRLFRDELQHRGEGGDGPTAPAVPAGQAPATGQAGVAGVRALHQPSDTGECRECHASSPCPTIRTLDAAEPATDQTALRDRIAEALYRHSHPGWATRYADLDRDERDTYLGRADAVLSALPASVDRAAGLARIREVVRRLAAHAVGFKDVLDDADHGPWGRTVGADIAELIEALSDQPAAEPAVGAPQPKEAHAPETVAYRSNGGRLLRCIAHAPEWAAILCGDFHPVTSEDLPDGGICTMPDCGVDVLIPQQPKEA